MNDTQNLPTPPVASRAPAGEDPGGDRAVQRLARTTGLVFVALLAFGMFSPIALDSLIVPGDAAATAESVLGSRQLFGADLVSWVLLACADVAAAVTLYFLLRPAGQVLSMLAAAGRLMYAAMLFALVPQLFDAFGLLTGTGRGAGLGQAQRQVEALAQLETFGVGFRVALVVFGAHLVLIGILLHRSRYVPRALAGLIVASGTGYVVHNLAGFFVDLSTVVTAVLFVPMVLGEISLMLWLLVKGVKIPRNDDRLPATA